MPGTLYCICISRSKQLPEAELKIFGVRKRIFLPDGWVHSTALAPSIGLLSKTEELKAEKKWNKESFEEVYQPAYLHEINSSKNAKDELALIAKHLKNGNNVAYGCYCGDHLICHRGIVGKIFQNVGYHVIFI